MTTVKKLSNNASPMDTSTLRRSLAISEHSSIKGTPAVIRDWLTSLPLAFPVNPFQSPGISEAKTTHEICGLKRSRPFASYDPALPYLKTCQLCLLTGTDEPFSETWPRAGISVDGEFYRLPKSERRIKEIGYGFMPTPNTMDGLPARSKEAMQRQFAIAQKGRTAPANIREWRHPNLWPTATAAMAKGSSPATLKRKCGRSRIHDRLDHAVMSTDGGQLNPAWVEWMMGWAEGWSSLQPLNNIDYDFKTAWLADPSEKGDIKRTVTGLKDRAKRLKALGNGQVPQCVFTVWHLLSTREF